MVKRILKVVVFIAVIWSLISVVSFADFDKTDSNASSFIWAISSFSIILIAVLVVILINIRINVMNKKDEIYDRNINEFLNGFKNGEFKMYFQFIIDNNTKHIAYCEALSRWDRGDKGILTPGSYIKDMEKTSLISKHDYYMFEKVCQCLEKWNDTKYCHICISCNFTRITLSESDFIKNIREISQRYNFDTSRLAIEITEDVIEKDTKQATKNVMECKKLGFKIALDDLGCGYTSLSNLCDYPIDIVKIDRDILGKTQTQKGKDLYSGIISLAHSLNIKVVSEGVETIEQEEFISNSDCDYIQGFLYSRPLPQSQWGTFVDEYEKGLNK